LKKEVAVAIEQADRGNKAPMEQLLGKKDSIPQDISSSFEHPDFKEAARVAGRTKVNYTGEDLTPPLTAFDSKQPQKQKTR
jgi:hypothetical protein